MPRAGRTRSAGSRRGGSGGSRGAMPSQLRRSYLSGKVAPRIRWGTGGDFKRCVRQGRKHGMGSKAEGACARLHKAATGQWPGRGRRH